eukprot:1294746-Amphidinium_carterae.2
MQDPSARWPSARAVRSRPWKQSCASKIHWGSPSGIASNSLRPASKIFRTSRAYSAESLGSPTGGHSTFALVAQPDLAARGMGSIR